MNNFDDKAWLDYQNRQSRLLYNADSYEKNSLRSWAMQAGHKFAEKNISSQKHYSRVLEIGAGSGRHLPFIKHSFDQYILSDVNTCLLQEAKAKNSNIHKGKLRYEIQDAKNLGYDDSYFDRLIAVHVLEHIYEPHLAIQEWLRVIKNGGMLSVLIPTDPGLAWRMGRRLGPRKNALNKGIAYDYIMAREHVNSVINLIAFLRHYISSPQKYEYWWPCPIASIDMNLFFSCNAVIHK
ncbi:MAG: class I SAM-dependent methyltransferase [Desulfarculales bacterium]|jgi:ubiquinone/menaquinone biosynthesis C-methylase UbiE|nr:class I SAM-dependent methyltransferase [Desulfarculales bacterium]